MTITSLLAIVLIALYGLTILSVPFSIGKERKPVTASQATSSIIFGSIIIYLLLQLV